MLRGCPKRSITLILFLAASLIIVSYFVEDQVFQWKDQKNNNLTHFKLYKYYLSDTSIFLACSKIIGQGDCLDSEVLQAYDKVEKL